MNFNWIKPKVHPAGLSPAAPVILHSPLMLIALQEKLMNVPAPATTGMFTTGRETIEIEAEPGTTAIVMCFAPNVPADDVSLTIREALE